MTVGSQWVDDPAGPNPLYCPRIERKRHDGRHPRRPRLHVEGPLSANVLRNIPVGRIEALANALLAPALGGSELAQGRALLPEHLLERTERTRSDEFYAAVAATYRHLVA